MAELLNDYYIVFILLTIICTTPRIVKSMESSSLVESELVSPLESLTSCVSIKGVTIGSNKITFDPY